MKTTLRIIATTMMGALLAATPALAQGKSDGAPHGAADRPKERPPRQAMPEFDPAAAGAIAAILGGGAVLVLRRRKQ